MDRNTNLETLFDAVLRKCKLQASETLVVLTRGDAYKAYADTYLLAAKKLGATAIEVKLPPPPIIHAGGRTSLLDNSLAAEVLKIADMVIDTVGIMYSDEERAAKATGTRVLMCMEPPELIARLFPTEERQKRLEIAKSMIQAAKVLRVTSPAGTDVTYKLNNQYKIILVANGFVDQPGQWDHLPSGFLAAHGDDDGVEGVVVIDAGDILLQSSRYVRDPVALTIEKGIIRDIKGGGMDAKWMSSYMKGWNDPRAYAVSHIGWGMNEMAHWETLGANYRAAQTGGMEYRASYGNVLFSTGPNEEFDGDNNCGCHLDIPMHGCSLFLDDEEILRDGVIIPDALRAEGR